MEDFKDSNLVRSAWQAATEELNAAVALRAAQLYDEVVARYSEPHRRYHTMGHLHQFVAVAEEFVPHYYQHADFYFACFWHDVVYDTARTDNEERSAEQAVQWLHELGAEAKSIRNVRELIMATKSHEPRGDGELREACCYFLDCDMSILGSESGEYTAYSRAIREEYGSATEDQFRLGRRAFLQKTLQRETIFLTDEFHAAFEQQARANMANELQKLSTTG